MDEMFKLFDQYPAIPIGILVFLAIWGLCRRMSRKGTPCVSSNRRSAINSSRGSAFSGVVLVVAKRSADHQSFCCIDCHIWR